MSHNIIINLRDHEQGGVVPVRAQPGAKKERFVGVHGGALKLAVSAPPEDGKANKALTALLATLLNVKKTDVELIHGKTNRDKQFLIRGVSVRSLRERITTAIQHHLDSEQPTR